MGRPKDPPTLSALGLSQETIDKIQDLREAFLGAPDHRVIAHAIEFYLAKGIDAEPEVKRRYEEEQRRRLAAEK
jgi:hypothetical protein